ncbi:MAG: gliding motility-associated C-terminal domain-containing protein [Bacteroidales bacterium]|nr:gliding motility-associated C-terminal domain-containing protein [Bacteroidales bacterium]
MACIKYIALLAFTVLISTFSNGQSPNLGTVCAESTEKYGVDGYADSEFIWSVEGASIIDGDGRDTISVKWGYRIGTYLIEVQEVTKFGCTGVPQTARVTVHAPQVNLGYIALEICEGESHVFDARSNSYLQPYTMQWHDGTYAPTYTATESELIWVKVTDGLGCFRYDSVMVVSNPLPTVNLGPDTLLCDDLNPYRLNAGDFAQYVWRTTSGNSSTGNPFYVYPVKGSIDTVSVMVTDYNGCTASDSIVVMPCNVLALFKDIPNTITPNNDGNNDVWNIPYMEQFPNAVLEIFDRWGRLVYRTTDVYGQPWDGTSNGRPMPMDAYFFVIDLRYMNLETFSGTINLIR